MALSNPRLVFGVHSFSPYKISTGEFYGTVKVLDSSSFQANSELIELTGGSQSFPFGVERGASTAELSLSFSQYDDFLFELAYGKAPTANVAEADGDCSALAAKFGTVIDATTGIASVSVEAGEESELKFGKFLVVTTAEATVDVFMSSDVDFARGTDGEFLTDGLQIATGVTIPDSGGTVSLTGYGVEFTSGSGTIALVTLGAVGDSVTFETRPINDGSMEVTIGGSADVAPEFGAILYGQQRGNEQMIELDIFRMQLSGLPLGFSKKEWSTAEVTAKAFYDSERNGVYSVRTIKPV